MLKKLGIKLGLLNPFPQSKPHQTKKPVGERKYGTIIDANGHEVADVQPIISDKDVVKNPVTGEGALTYFVDQTTDEGKAFINGALHNVERKRLL